MKLFLSVALALISTSFAAEDPSAVADREARREALVRKGGRRAQDSSDGGNDDPCFSGDTLVDVLGHSTPVAMRNVKLGDQLMTSNGEYSLVYSFHHVNAEQEADFIRLEHADGTLEITAKHFIHKADASVVRADQVRVGDVLKGMHNKPMEILSIDTTTKTGVYAPVTVTGDLVVDGLVASAYASLLSDVSPLLQDYAFHIMYAPHRVYCSHFAKCEVESYDSKGYNWMVANMGFPFARMYENSGMAASVALVSGLYMMEMTTSREL